MKKTWSKLFACLLALVMALAFTGCKLTDETTKPAEAATDAADVDNDAIAISIGDGKYTVTRGEMAEAYDNMVMQYSYFGMSAPTADADIESMQDSIAHSLAVGQVIQYQAELMGITLDDAAMKDVDDEVQENMDQVTAEFKAQAESEGAADVEARTVEIFNTELQNAGLDMDMEGYRDYLKGMIEKDALAAAVEAKVKSAATSTEADAKAYYDDLFETQKKNYTDNPGDYLEDQEAYEKFGGDPILLTPEGYIRVRTITVAPKEAISEDYSTLMTEMGTLEAEYGNLALNNAAGNAARIAEIKTEHAAKKTEADKMHEDYVAPSRKIAEDALQSLTDGEAFVDAIKEFGTDEVYTTYPSFLNTGLLMQKGVASSTWPQELVDAVDKLKAGEHSDVINIGDSFYIVELVGDEPAGEAPYGDVEEEMLRLSADVKGETLWTDQQAEWLDDPSIVTFHEEVYCDVGKAVG